MSAIKQGFSKIRHSLKDHSPHHVHKLREKTSSNSSRDEVVVNGTDDVELAQTKNQRKKLEKQKEHDEKRRSNEHHEEELRRKRKEEDERVMREESQEIRARYGVLTVNQSRTWNHEERHSLSHLASKHTFGDKIVLRARVSHIRKLSAKLMFIVLREQEWSIQGVLQEHNGIISEHFVRWAEHLDTESIVLVKGSLKEPRGEVMGATIHNMEINILELHVISQLTEPLPFSVYEADITQGEIERGAPRRKNLPDRTRLSNRVIDLRTSASLAVFRINSGICNIFRSYLDSLGFIEIHTPKLQGGATESGSSVFQLDYFGRPAFLAQSPQLAKQMCISADFERVYEIGPVFRAENSNTHRHLTEYTGLDLEMAFEEHYHETLTIIDSMLKQTWKGIYERFGHEIEVIKRQFPHEDLVWLEETPRIPFKKGIQLLRDSGWTDEHGNPPSYDEDLSTRDEIRLGQLVKEKYHTDYYIIDKFPVSARPFYTMPDPDDPKTTNSYDFFLRGQEILSGGQRIHDAKMLEDQMATMKLQHEGMEEYLDGFRWGAPPHAGGGIGLERVIMLLLGLGDIRLASLFPRDPKSLTSKRPPTDQLRHPEASTLHPPWEADNVHGERDYQPLEKLIANYGDSSNTSYLEDRTQIWRCYDTGAAIGYVPIEGYAMILGNPLCEKIQYGTIISAFLKWIKKDTKMKPIWLLCGYEVEEVLGSKLAWRTLTCAAEQRKDLTVQQHFDHDVERKVRKAESEGVKVADLPAHEPVPKDIQSQCALRLKDWVANRKGTQVHLGEMEASKVFNDTEHRIYFYARDKQGTMCALIVLAQLSSEHGYQIKYSLDFPGAPSGTIEHITLHALKAAKTAGIKSVTFGGGAHDHLTPVHGLHGMHVKVLERAYHAIVSHVKLTSKSEFREKLGVEEDPIYVCYPKSGLGPQGAHAIMKFFGAEE